MPIQMPPSVGVLTRAKLRVWIISGIISNTIRSVVGRVATEREASTSTYDTADSWPTLMWRAKQCRLGVSRCAGGSPSMNQSVRNSSSR